jgi:hypothetical protein
MRQVPIAIKLDLRCTSGPLNETLGFNGAPVITF